MMHAAVDKHTKNVNGMVCIKLYKGNVLVVSRKSSQSLYDDQRSTIGIQHV